MMRFFKLNAIIKVSIAFVMVVLIFSCVKKKTDFKVNESQSQDKLGEKYEEFITEGERCLSKPDIDSAKIYFNRANKIDTNGIYSLYGLGVSFTALRALNKMYCDSAILYLNKCEAIDSSFRNLSYNMSACLYQKSDYAGALRYVNNALSNDSLTCFKYYLKAQILLTLKDTTGACDEFHHGRRIDTLNMMKLDELSKICL